MPINIESHGLAAAAPYNAPVTTQDQQGDGHDQPGAPEAGFSSASAFENVPGSSAASATATPEAPDAGGDLLSKLSGFIRAVGDVVVQLGELIRSAGGALGGEEEAQPQAAQPAQVSQGEPGPLLAGAPGQPVTAASLPSQAQAQLAAPLVYQASQASQDARGGGTSTPASRPSLTQRGVSNPALASLSMAASSLGLAAGAPHGGTQNPSSGGFPELNPLPPFHREEEGFFPGFPGYEPGIPLRPASEHAAVLVGEVGGGGTIHGSSEIEPAVELLDVGGVGHLDPGVAGDGGFQGSGEPAAARAERLPIDPRFSGVVFRPAYYGLLRC